MSDPVEFDALMERVRRHSDGAARELLDRYGVHVLRVVRRRLHKRLRSKFDSADFVQAVWASFFALPPDRLNFDRPDGLVAFLVALARNKVVEAVRQRLQSLKFNLNRERSLEESMDKLAQQLCVREPTPWEIAVAREEWERLLEKEPSRRQGILVCLGAGSSPREVAQKLGVSEKTVRRVIERVRRRKPK